MSDLEKKNGGNHQSEQRNEKYFNEDGIWLLWGNIKHSNIHNVGISEEERG